MRLFKKDRKTEHESERKQIRQVKRRLTDLEGRMAYVESEVKVIKREK